MKIRISLRGKPIQLDISGLFFILLVFMFFAGYFIEFIMIYTSILVHEIGHCVIAACAKRRILSVRVLLMGLVAWIDTDDSSTKEKVRIYLCGPLVNTAMGLVAVLLFHMPGLGNRNLHFFYIINFYLAVFNLLPIQPLDGGKIMKTVLVGHFGLFRGSRILRSVSLVLSILLVALGFIQLFHNYYNFSLLVLGVFLYLNLRKEEMEAALMNIKQVVYRRARLFKRGIYGARDLVAIKNVRIGEVLKHMDFDRFHFIYVLDENLRLIKIISEQEIVEAILQHNAEITFEEFLALEKL